MEPVQELIPGRFSDRFVAYLLDTIPFVVGAVGSVWVWGGPLSRPITNENLLAIGAAWAGLAVLWQFAGNLAGGTPGKKLLGLAVVTADGSFPGFGRALARSLGWVLSTPFANFGFLVALFHPRTRALHDLLAGTYVVEAGPRRSNGALLFLAAAPAAIGLFALQYWTNMVRPTPEDLAAIARAENGLNVIARVEESCREKNGTYAATVADLAEASGDVELFRSAMLDVFRPTPFKLVAGNKRWRVVAAAKDRRNTLVSREGP
ncbi:MAG: RDD family protein [Elusimicrobiota bacterium]